MATQQVTQGPVRYNASAAVKYPGLRRELRTLRVGRTFKVTFLGRYSASCGRNALSHFCRHVLGYQVESHQRGNVLEITRTK
jgi:hypothetical protein